MSIEQFAKISSFVNENGVLLVYYDNTYSCNEKNVKLKDNEIGICISFTDKKNNADFLNNNKITITEDNKKYLIYSLITMNDGKPVKLINLTNIDNGQFPGLNIDIYDIDTGAFTFEKTADNSSYKITGVGKSEPKIVNGSLIIPYEYKSENDDDPIPVTVIDGTFNGLPTETNVIIPSSIVMMRDNAFLGCNLILTKHVLVF